MKRFPALRQGYRLVRETLDEFIRHRGGLLAAALAFHTLLAMAPLIIVAVAIAGMIVGRGTARAEMNRLLLESVGETLAAAVEQWVEQAVKGGEAASIAGVALMLVTASKLGARIREALNQLWGIQADPLIPAAGDYARRRLVSFALAISSGPALLAVVASRALLTVFHERLFASTPRLGSTIQLLMLVLSLLIATGLFALVFRYVPDARLSWKSVWIGSALTALLFIAGNTLIDIYLEYAFDLAAYGAAGFVMTLLIWLYVSAHSFLFGATFTRTCERKLQRRGRPQPAPLEPRGA